jgi:glycosyltransferase involved in cell wall biosynthesis
MIKARQHNRVLLLVENNSFPEDIRVFHEATTLIDAGYTVSVICPSKPNLPQYEKSGGIHIFRYPPWVAGNSTFTYLGEFGYSLLAMFYLSLFALWKPGFDIIHAANPPDTAVFIAAAYKMLGKKFIFDQHDLSPEIYLLRFGPGKKAHKVVFKTLIALERLSCKLADHIIAPNVSYKMLEIQRCGVPADRITVVRNGPDLPAAVRHGISECNNGKKTLLYVGVIGIQDGVDYLVRALHFLKYRFMRGDFSCVIVGDGSALPSMKALAFELGLQDLILFTGWVKGENVPDYIDSADICLAPEPSNDLNNRSTMIKVMEYMAFCKPIVAFNLPEHRETAREAAIYAEPNDEEDFAQKIALLMDDPKRCREMGQIGRDRIEKELCWMHQKAYLLEAYTKIERKRKI